MVSAKRDDAAATPPLRDIVDVRVASILCLDSRKRLADSDVEPRVVGRVARMLAKFDSEFRGCLSDLCGDQTPPLCAVSIDKSGVRVR